MLKLGWKMGGDESSIWIAKGNERIEFDILIPTPKGSLYVMHMKRIDINGEVANPSVRKPNDQKKISIGKAHGTF
jgi:hypothetical protein